MGRNGTETPVTLMLLLEDIWYSALRQGGEKNAAVAGWLATNAQLESEALLGS